MFDSEKEKISPISKPLAERMRPQTLSGFAGHENITGKDSLIRAAIENDRIFSMIIWGPPGCGKTTLARIIAKETSSHYVAFSAVLSGVKEIRSVIKIATDQLELYKKKTILFVDEIHRFNKAQQDAFLHHVESGLITLIGATTENPSFEVIPPLLSRCRVITLKPLLPEDIEILLKKAIADKEHGLGDTGIEIEKNAIDHLVEISEGDARAALNALETATILSISPDISTAASPGKKDKTIISLKDIEEALQKKAMMYDKSGEEHFNLISALHKSLRGSDPDAALYWLGRMLVAGEDPLYLARRMVRFASEDIGNADPYALTTALNAMEAFKFIGRPEGELALAQAAVYLATAPKSNALYTAYSKVKDTINQKGYLPVPHHIRNAPTRLMKELGYGKNYKYAHDYEEGVTDQEHLPEQIKGRRFYFPTDRGFEKTIKNRLEGWKKIKAQRRADKKTG